MEIETLRTFVEVLRKGSFAAVARDRDVDPSSVSRTIAGLEEALGVRLFNRTTRKLSPTEAALAYFDRVEPLAAELERAALAAADSGQTPRGTLRITAPIAFAQMNIVPLLPELASLYPELSFELLFTDKFLDLIEERVDVAVRLGRLAESSLIAHRLCSVVFVACASPEYLRKSRRLKKPADLEQHDCLRYPFQGYGARWRFRRNDGPVTEISVGGRVVAANGVALRQCAVAGMGVVLLPRWTVADELRSGALVQICQEFEATPSVFDSAAWVVYPSRSYLPLKVRVFSDFLKKKFKNGAPAEVGLTFKEQVRHARKRGAPRSSRLPPALPVRRAREDDSV